MHSNPPSSGSASGVVDAAVRVLELLHRTVQALRLYPTDHPLVVESADGLARAIDVMIGAGGPLDFGIAPDHILLDDQELRSEAIGQLASMLHGLDVSLLEVR